MLQRGASVLAKACYEGHIDIVALLLSVHPEVDLPNDVRYSYTITLCMHKADIDSKLVIASHSQ